jgi:hypothetical protein
MRPRLAIPAVVLAGACAPCAADDSRTWTDARGDAVVRRTAPGALNPLSTLPDLVELRVSGWQTPTPVSNPYNGTTVDGSDAHLVRIDLVLAGVINPPGPNTATNFDPFRFGNSPVYGFIEFDVDRDADTGGELGAAGHRYLANVGRFGGLPHESAQVSRAARWGLDVDGVYGTTPQYERSGADFVLAFCGCITPTIVQEGGNGNGVFEAGETWIVQGRFFQRSGGYQQASFAFGGSQAGLYDPVVKLRFSHNTGNNTTTISLVFALDGAGAGQLLGTGPQAVNYSVNDAAFVQEALQDLIDAATTLPLTGATRDLAIRWVGRSAAEFLDPTRWRATALVGTAYAQPAAAPFVWTDVGYDEVWADVNGDGWRNVQDRLAVRAEIQAHDGGPRDGDGVVNGSVLIIDPGPNWSLYDVNGSGAIDTFDSLSYCRADINDDLALNVLDFVAFINAYAGGDLRADVDGNGVLNILDFTAFINQFVAGCP